jgi:hypothetical protein
MNTQSLPTLAVSRRMKITAIAICLGIFSLAIAGTIRVAQAKAARRTAALVPTMVTVCKQVEDNGDADHTQGGTFGYIVSDQANTLGSPSLTRTENQSSNPPVCSAPIAIPGGSTQLQVIEAVFPPTSTWPRNEGGYPLWTATNGTTTINGSGETPADLSSLSGDVTITFSNRVGRKVTFCKLVEPNAIAPNNQGATWNILGYFPPVIPGHTAFPITADETSGTVCLPPVNLPLGATSVDFDGAPLHGLISFPGFPKFNWTTTGGQSASGSISSRIRVPVATTSGDITITVINKFDEPRVLNVCTQLLSNGDATSDGGEFRYMTSIPGFTGTIFTTFGVAEGGPVVCSSHGSFNVPSSASSFKVGASQYHPNWPGNAIGYPKWELRDGNNPTTLLASGTGDYTTVDYAALGVSNVRFVMINKAGPFGNGSDPTTGKIMRVCKRVDNNGDAINDGLRFRFLSLEFGVLNGIEIGFGAVFDRTVKESDGLVCDYSLAVHNGDTEFQVKEAPVLLEWPGHAPGYPKWEVLNPANTVLQNGQAVDLPTRYSNYLAAQINTTTLTGDSTFVMHNKAGNRKLTMCVNVMDNGFAPVDSAKFQLAFVGGESLETAVTAEGSANCVVFGAPSSSTQLLGLYLPQAPWPGFAYGFPTYSYTTSGGGSGSGVGANGSNTFFVPFDFAAPANAGDIIITFTAKPGRRMTICKQLLNNGDGIDNSGIFKLGQGTDSGINNVNFTATEGGAVVCGTMDRIHNGSIPTQAIAQELSLPANWPGNTPGFPLFNWTTTGGQSGTGSGNSVIFDLTNTPGVSGIENTTGDITITFLNRTGPPRVLTLCKEVESNGDSMLNQGGVFTLTGGGNVGTPGTYPLTQTEGQPRVCSPPIQLDPLATTISAMETAPGNWPGNAAGFPQWTLLDGANATVTSGTGTPTSNLSLNSFTGNPTIVFRNRAVFSAKLSINDVTVTEGNSGTVNAVFTVSLDAPSNQPITVQYATADGTANAPGDYAALPLTTLTFPPNTLSQTITVQVKGDTTLEPDETFFVNMSNPINATLANSQGLGTIVNDDCLAPLTLTPASLPAATLGAPYSQPLSASGGDTPYNFTVGAGTQLPPGLSLSAAGMLSGAPTQMSTFSFTVVATSANGCTGTKAYSLVVSCPVIMISPSALPNSTAGVAYSQSLTATGGTPTYSFSIASGSLPLGLSLSSTGLLSGTTTQFGDFPITVTVKDQGGCTTSQNYLLKINQRPVAKCKNITVTAGAACLAEAAIDDGSSDPDGDSLTITQSPAGPYTVGTHTVTLTVNDGRGAISQCTATVTVKPPAPVVAITGPPSGSLYQVNTPVNFTGTFVDLASTSPHTASWQFVSGANSFTQAGVVNETAGTVSSSYTFTTAGVYLVTLTVTNNCGGQGQATQIGDLAALVVVYDPGAGFVTGGGWIDSAAGAFVQNPTLTGKANFGFVSKYQKGASVPTGQTEFQFKVANLNFHISSYDWLVVAGARAQYKGTGTINGSGNYAFMLTAIDGQINGGGGQDKFRIRIWDKGSGGLVYDNQLNAPDSADPTTVLGGGSIVIHK